MSLDHSVIGHRDRLKSVVRNGGLASLPDYQQIEFLLFFGIPYKDVQPLAKELLAKYGSLRKICAADPKELKSFKNMTSLAVDLLKAMPAAFEIYSKPDEETPVFLSPNNITRHVKTLFSSAPDEETLYVLSLNGRQRLLHTDRVDGDRTSIRTSYRAIVEIALKNNAEVIILAHNHPSAFVEPSPSDLQSTRVLKDLLQSLGITLADHIIVTPKSAYSMLLNMVLRDDDYAYQLDNLERYMRLHRKESVDPTPPV